MSTLCWSHEDFYVSNDGTIVYHCLMRTFYVSKVDGANGRLFYSLS